METQASLTYSDQYERSFAYENIVINITLLQLINFTFVSQHQSKHIHITCLNKVLDDIFKFIGFLLLSCGMSSFRVLVSSILAFELRRNSVLSVLQSCFDTNSAISRLITPKSLVEYSSSKLTHLFLLIWDRIN